MQTAGGGAQGGFAASLVAKSAVTMGRNIEAKGVSAKMGDFTEKFDRSFGIAVFELSVGGAHTAE